MIVIVREPITAFIAEFNRKFGKQERNKHVSSASLQAFQTQEWPKFVEEKFKHWLSMNSNAAKFYSQSQICVIIYEELVINTATGMFVLFTFAKRKYFFTKQNQTLCI